MAEIKVKYDLGQVFYVIKTTEVQKIKSFSIEKCKITEVEINAKTGIFYNGFLEEEMYLDIESVLQTINKLLIDNIYETR